jgi:hypothetical protein
MTQAPQLGGILTQSNPVADVNAALHTTSDMIELIPKPSKNLTNTEPNVIGSTYKMSGTRYTI